jgi:hypothetical protein
MNQEMKTITKALEQCPLVAKIGNLKFSHMIYSKLRKHHKMSQGMEKNFIEVLIQCPLVAKNEKIEIELYDQH